MWTPVENLKRYFLSSPPWVIFVLSLGIMATGVIILAYRFNIDDLPDLDDNVRKVARFCLKDYEIDKSSVKNPSASGGSFNVSTSVHLTVSQAFFYFYSNGTNPLVIAGSLYSDQLGFQSKQGASNSTYTFELYPDFNATNCITEACSQIKIESCLIVRSEEPLSLSFSKDSNNCGNLSSLFANRASAFEKLELVSQRDLAKKPSRIIAPKKSTSSGNVCSKGSTLFIENKQPVDDILFPMVHDTMMARLHLLYTSYFLLFSVLVILSYAMCRRVGHRIKHHHDKELVEDQTLTRYARLK